MFVIYPLGKINHFLFSFWRANRSIQITSLPHLHCGDLGKWNARVYLGVSMSIGFNPERPNDISAY